MYTSNTLPEGMGYFVRDGQQPDFAAGFCSISAPFMLLVNIFEWALSPKFHFRFFLFCFCL
jgi:hypothetical protein